MVSSACRLEGQNAQVKASRETKLEMTPQDNDMWQLKIVNHFLDEDKLEELENWRIVYSKYHVGHNTIVKMWRKDDEQLKLQLGHTFYFKWTESQKPEDTVFMINKEILVREIEGI